MAEKTYCETCNRIFTNEDALAMHNSAKHFKKDDILVTIAMDGENAWEFYNHDGHDFLNLLYEKLSDSEVVRTTTVSDTKIVTPRTWARPNSFQA